MNPRAGNRNNALFREFAVGALVLSLLLTMFVYAAYRRFGTSVTARADIGDRLMQPTDHPSIKPTQSDRRADDSAGSAATAKQVAEYDRTDEKPPPTSAPDFLPSPLSFETAGEPVANRLDAASRIPPTVGDTANVTDKVLATNGDASFVKTSDFDTRQDPILQSDSVREFPYEIASKPLKGTSIVLTDSVQNERQSANLLLDLNGGNRVDRNVPVARYYVIQAKDSFWKIAHRTYGNGQYFRALAAFHASRFADPDQLPVGGQMEIPLAEELEQLFPSLCPPSREIMNSQNPIQQTEYAADSSTRDYVVRAGESLFDIARFELRQASRYVEIIRLNHDVFEDETMTAPMGTLLRIPAE